MGFQPSSLLTTDFLVFRRFSTLSLRALLFLQDEIAVLGKKIWQGRSYRCHQHASRAKLLLLIHVPPSLEHIAMENMLSAGMDGRQKWYKDRRQKQRERRRAEGITRRKTRAKKKKCRRSHRLSGGLVLLHSQFQQ